jgi:hypothetical protein
MTLHSKNIPNDTGLMRLSNGTWRWSGLHIELMFYLPLGQGSVENGDTAASKSADSPRVPVEINNMDLWHTMQDQHVGGLKFRGLH